MSVIDPFESFQTEDVKDPFEDVPAPPASEAQQDATVLKMFEDFTRSNPADPVAGLTPSDIVTGVDESVDPVTPENIDPQPEVAPQIAEPVSQPEPAKISPIDKIEESAKRVLSEPTIAQKIDNYKKNAELFFKDLFYLKDTDPFEPEKPKSSWLSEEDVKKLNNYKENATKFFDGLFSESKDDSKESSWIEILNSKLDTIPAMFRKTTGAALFKAGSQKDVLQSEAEKLVKDLPDKNDTSLSASWDRFKAAISLAPVIANQLPRLVAEANNPETKDTLEKLDQGLKSLGAEIYTKASKDIKKNYPELEKGSAKYYASNTIDALANMVPMIVSTVVTKSPTVGASVMGSQVYVDKYKEMLDKGSSPSEAEQAALAYSVFELVPESVALKVIMEPGGNFLKRVLKASGAEGLQEAITESLQAGYDAGVLKEDMTWGEVVDRVKDSFIVGSLSGGAMRTIADPFIQKVGSEQVQEQPTDKPAPGWEEQKAPEQPVTEEPLPASTEEPVQNPVESGQVTETPVEKTLDDVEVDPSDPFEQPSTDNWTAKTVKPENPTAEVDLDAPYKFDSPKVEARIRKAQEGLGESVDKIQLLKEAGKHAVTGFTRRYEKLPPSKRWARTINNLRKIEETPAIAKEEADTIVYSLVGKMNRRQMDDFSLKVLLDDLKYMKSDQKSKLPFDLTIDQLNKAHDDITARVKQDPIVAKAIKNRLDIIKKVGKDLVSRKLLSEEQIKNPSYFHRQVIEYAQEQSFLQRAVKKVSKQKKGFMYGRLGSDKDYNANYLEAEFSYLEKAFESIRTHDRIMDEMRREDLYPEHKQNIREKNGDLFEKQFANNNELMNEFLEMQAKGLTTTMDKFLKTHLGKDYVSPTDKHYFPDGYVEWQYDKGNWIYTAQAVPEKVHEELIEAVNNGALSNLGIAEELLESIVGEIKKVAAIGAKKPTYLIPEEVEFTLNNLKPKTTRTGIMSFVAWTTRKWKVWRLFNPITAPRYFLNNFASDAEVVLTVQPGILKELLPSIKELIDVHYLHKEPSIDYIEAREESVFATGFTIQELPDINLLQKYQHLLQAPPSGVKKATMSFWNGIKNFNQFRENWFRLAAYKHFKKRLEAGEDVGNMASLPQMLDQMRTPVERAGMLSRELIGDYGNLSRHGQELRETFAPFFSWVEVNMRRYTRFISDAFRQGVGEGLKAGGLVGVALGAKITAYMLVRLFLVYGMLSMWNMMMFPDEEDDLPDYVQKSMHIIYGVDESGKTMYLSFAGALSDFLSWFGFSDVASAANKVERGDGGVKEYAEVFKDKVADIPANAVNKTMQLITPVLKGPTEAILGISTFPDVWKPRNNPTPLRSMAQIWEFQAFYDIYSKHPSKGFYESTIGKMLLVNKSDPLESSYFKIRQKAYDFISKDKGISGFSTVDSNKTRAMQAYRKSLRLKDNEARDFWLAELKNAGMSMSDIRKSLKSLHPLAPVPSKDRAKFRHSLDKVEKEQLYKAIKYYNIVYK